MSEGITPSSGNVFVDIGLPYPEEALAKSQLAYRIATIIKARGMSQAEYSPFLLGYGLVA